MNNNILSLDDIKNCFQTYGIKQKLFLKNKTEKKKSLLFKKIISRGLFFYQLHV